VGTTVLESIGNLKTFLPRSRRRPSPPAAMPCSRHVRRPQRAAAAPPERPAARGSAVWTSGSAWARGAPQRCPGGQAAGRVVGKADGQRDGKRSEGGDTPSLRARRQRNPARRRRLRQPHRTLRGAHGQGQAAAGRPRASAGGASCGAPLALASTTTRPRSLAQLQDGVPGFASSPSTPCWRGVGIIASRRVLCGAQQPA
jgi:hypothetical protein